MESIGKDCGALKQEYDACFNKWYSEQFLKGEVEVSENYVPCEELFKVYRDCVTVFLSVSFFFPCSTTSFL